MTTATPLLEVHIALLKRLATANASIVVFHDSLDDAKRAEQDRKLIEATGAHFVRLPPLLSELTANASLTLETLQMLYGGPDKLGYFGGRSKRPRHLLPAVWLAHSSYAYAWIIESDVFVRDVDKLRRAYRRFSAPLICAHSVPGPPEWRYPWRWGDDAHAVPAPAVGFVDVYVMRWSRELARSLLISLLLEQVSTPLAHVA